MLARLACLTAAALATALLPHPATAAGQVLAPPAGSKWILERGADKCHLMREFGEGESLVTLLLAQSMPGSQFQMVLGGRPLGRFVKGRPVAVAFGPSGDLGRREAFAAAAVLDSLGPALVFSSVGLTRSAEGEASADAAAALMLPPAAIAAADRIELSQDGQDALLLQPNGLDQALTAFDACSQQRLAGWGLDAAAHRTLTRRARARNMADLARRVQQHYPRPGLLQSREQGIVNLRVIVEPDGTASDCVLTRASDATTLGTNACSIFNDNADFEPALDATGAPMRSFFTATIVYRG